MSYVQVFIHAVVRTYKSENTLPTDDRIKFLYQDMLCRPMRDLSGLFEISNRRLKPPVNKVKSHAGLLKAQLDQRR